MDTPSLDIDLVEVGTTLGIALLASAIVLAIASRMGYLGCRHSHPVTE